MKKSNSLNRKMNIYSCANIRVVLIVLLTLLAKAPMVLAGEYHTEEEIKHEISFLAAKLLEISGKDTYFVESPARLLPFIGICTSISEEGIAITCVTPGSQAEKGGLVSGDIVTELNELSMLNEDEVKTKRAYSDVFKTMKTGDDIKLKVQREDKILQLDLTVGSVDHPAFNCEINNK